MKKKKSILKIVACILVLSLSLTILQPISVFAEQNISSSQTTLKKWVPSEEDMRLPNTKGDLTLEQLETAKLSTEDIPEYISQEDIEEKGHVNRLREQEPNDNTIVFQNRDGTKTAYFFSNPVKYTDKNGNVNDKRTKLDIQNIPAKYSEKYGYVNQQNDIKAYFPKHMTTNQGMLLESEDISVELIPIEATEKKYVLQNGNLVTPQEYISKHQIVSNKTLNDISANNNDIIQIQSEKLIAQKANANKVHSTDKLTSITKDTVQYNGVFGNKTTLKYSSTFEGLKEDIVLFENTGVNNFSFKLKTNGLSLVCGEDKQYYLADPLSGEYLVAIGELIVYDSNNRIYKNDEGEEYNHHYEVLTVKSDEEYILTVVVDEEFLNSSDTVYPVYIDPTMTVMPKGSVRDAAIYSSGYAFANDEKIVKVGCSGSYGIGRGLYNFPILNFNTDFILMYGNQITSAKLRLYALPYGSSSSYDSSKTLSMYEFYSSWSPSTVKWNNTSPYNYGTYISGANVTLGWTSFDISYIVNKFKTDSDYTTNFKGVIIKANSENTSTWKKFVSSLNTTYSSTYRPYIQITYNDSPTPCSQVVSGATYYLKNYNGDYLDVYDAGTSDNTRLLTYTFNGNANQQFKITNVSGGEYEIAPQHTMGKVLSVNSSGQVVIEEDCNLSRQRWYIYYRNGNYHIVNKSYNNGVMGATYDTDYVTVNNEYEYCCWELEKLCGNANYRDVTRHNMHLLNNGYYRCSVCGFKVKSPELQDYEILSENDYLKIVSVQQYYSQCILLYEEQGITADYYKLQADTAKIYMDTIRSQDAYKNSYEYSNSQGIYHCVETNENLLSLVDITNINSLNIGLYNGVYQTIGSLIIGYWCPEVALLTDVLNLVTNQMNALDFGAFVAGLYEMSDLSVGLTIASGILGMVTSDVALGDKVVRVNFDFRVSAHYIYSPSNQIKQAVILYP